jgi:hypothetical protein
MVRKRDRVIGTLLVWIAVLISMHSIIQALNYAPVYLQNYWYYSGNVVVGPNSEEAMQVWQDFQSISSSLFAQTQQIARTELFNYYFPYVLFILAILLIGAGLSTLFIWRSVIVPAAMSEAIAAKNSESHEQTDARSLASLLDDDGEFIHPDADVQPTQNHRQILS